MFYLNITCGLALISQEKGIAKAIGLAAAVGLISSLTAVFNAVGRLGLSSLSDHLNDRNTIYKLIFSFSILFTALVIFSRGVIHSYAFLVLPMLFVVNAGYGGGFSSVPALLSDHFGMKSISRIHGLCLSAWAVAGLTGNQAASFIVNHTGSFTQDALGNLVNPVGYQNLLYFTGLLYAAALVICWRLIPKCGKKQAAANNRAS